MADFLSQLSSNIVCSETYFDVAGLLWCDRLAACLLDSESIRYS